MKLPKLNDSLIFDSYKDGNDRMSYRELPLPCVR